MSAYLYPAIGNTLASSAAGSCCRAGLKPQQAEVAKFSKTVSDALHAVGDGMSGLTALVLEYKYAAFLHTICSSASIFQEVRFIIPRTTSFHAALDSLTLATSVPCSTPPSPTTSRYSHVAKYSAWEPKPVEGFKKMWALLPPGRRRPRRALPPRPFRAAPASAARSPKFCLETAQGLPPPSPLLLSRS